MSSRSQFVEQRPCLFQIERIETLSEPAIDRSEKLAGFLPLFPSTRVKMKATVRPVSGRW